MYKRQVLSLLGVLRLLRGIPLLRLGILLLRVLLLVLGVLLVLLVLRLLGVLLLLVLGVLLILLLRGTGVRHLALLGLVPGPPLVPVQGVLRVPGFGATAPAILSHRSPRAARRRATDYIVRGARFRLFDGGRRLFECRLIARNVTVSRSDNHFDALARRIT